jgi:hypothetical protein
MPLRARIRKPSCLRCAKCDRQSTDSTLAPPCVAVPAFASIRGYTTAAGAVLCAFDLLEVNGEDLRHEIIEDRKRRLAGRLRLSHDGIVINETVHRRKRDDLSARLRARLRRHRVEAHGLALQGRSLGALA